MSNIRVSSKYPWMRCTLDGWVKELDCPLECKHVNPFTDMTTVLETYQPQLQHQMIVCDTDKAVLSVFFGTQRHEWQVVPRDEDYCKALVDRECLFWHSVESGSPPVGLTPVRSPVLPSEWRTVSFEGNNYFAEQAGVFIKTKEPAKQHEKAKDEIKGLMEADVGTAHGHGIVAKRDKRGAITIREGEI
jgi:hypothetical protein